MKKIITIMCSIIPLTILACQEEGEESPPGDLIVRLDDRYGLLTENDRDDVMQNLKEFSSEWNNCGSGRSIWIKNIVEPGTVPIIIVRNDDPNLFHNGTYNTGWTNFHNGHPSEIFIAKNHCQGILGHELGHAFGIKIHSASGIMVAVQDCNTDYVVQPNDCYLLPKE